MNVIDPILFQCKLNPAGPAICVPGAKDGLVSYARLERFIHNVSRTAHAHGLAHGQIVAITVKDMVLHAALMLGLARLGVATMSLSQAVIPAAISVDAVVSDSPAPITGTKRVLPADDGWLAGDGKPMADKSVYRRNEDDDACRLLLTSGTTGDAKVMVQTYGNLQRRTARQDVLAGNRFPACSRLYFDHGMGSSASLRYIVSTLSRGGMIFLYENSPEATIQAFELYKVQGMITTPASLALYAQIYEASPALQSGFDFIVANGGTVSKTLSERVRARLCANLFGTYGTTESGPVAVAPAQMLIANPGAVGLVVPDVTVEIVDQNDNVLAENEEGFLRIRSPYCPDGYLNNPAATAAVFRDGWIYPGDIARVSSEGMLFIVGRQSTTLHVGGHKVNPENVEEVLMSFPGVEQAGAVTDIDEGGADGIVALLVCRSTIDMRAIEAHCAASLPDTFVPVRFVQVKSLPRTPLGKLSRPQLLALARANRG